jgi:hypothetical protein
MLPGPNYVYKCPKCNNLLTKGSLMSGNTFGAEIFSDGKRIAPMLPEFPNLTKCKKCDTILWLSKLKEIGIYKWGDKDNSNWENANNAEFLSIEDYNRALDSGLAETKQEKIFIRQRIWWAYNDRKRNGNNQFIDENDEVKWKENCEKLISLLDYSNLNQRIMIAEIKRNLGDFKDCMEIIKGIDNDELNWLKNKVTRECELKNRWVIKLN